MVTTDWSNSSVQSTDWSPGAESNSGLLLSEASEFLQTEASENIAFSQSEEAQDTDTDWTGSSLVSTDWTTA